MTPLENLRMLFQGTEEVLTNKRGHNAYFSAAAELEMWINSQLAKESPQDDVDKKINPDDGAKPEILKKIKLDGNDLEKVKAAARVK